MNAIDRPHWDTEATDRSPDTSPAELSALKEHVDRLRISGDSRSALRRAAGALHGFLAEHRIMTWVLVAVLIALIAALS